MKRRALIASVSGVALTSSLAARAQQPVKTARVGFLIAGDAEPTWSQFRKSMTELGYVEGRNVHYEFRSGPAPAMAAHAVSVVEAKVDLIAAFLTPAILAAQKATSTIPIVFNGGLPESGLVKNLGRPEGNITGFYGATGALAGKSVEMLREIKPATRTIASLLNAADPFHIPFGKAIEDAAPTQKVEIVRVPINAPTELPAAFDSMAQRGVDGIIVQPSLPLKDVADLALKHRIPSTCGRAEYARLGGLISYGADQPALIEQVAGYADKVLKGTPTANLPVQLATRFELIVNQKTAKAVGIAFTPMFLGRVDDVIE